MFVDESKMLYKRGRSLRVYRKAEERFRQANTEEKLAYGGSLFVSPGISSKSRIGLVSCGGAQQSHHHATLPQSAKRQVPYIKRLKRQRASGESVLATGP